MKGRQYTLAELREFLAAVASRERAEAGDTALLVERARAGRASQHEIDFLADFAEGKVKRPVGKPASEKVRVRNMQAAEFFILLTKAIGLSAQAAQGRLADFYRVPDESVREWLKDERKRLGTAAWQAKLASAPADFALIRAWYMENEQLAELLKSGG